MLTKSTTIYQVKENRNWILIRLLLFSDFGVVMSWQKNKNKWSEWMNIYKYSKNKMMKSPFRFGCAVFVWLHSNYVRIRRFLITLGSIVFILLHISAWTIHWFHMDPIHSEWQISIWRVLFLDSVSMFSIFPLHYEVTEVWHVKRGPLMQPIPISKHAF